MKANYQVSKHFWPGAKSGKSEKQTNLTKSLEIWQHLLIKDLEVLTWFFFFLQNNCHLELYKLLEWENKFGMNEKKKHAFLKITKG